MFKRLLSIFSGSNKSEKVTEEKYIDIPVFDRQTGKIIRYNKKKVQ